MKKIRWRYVKNKIKYNKDKIRKYNKKLNKKKSNRRNVTFKIMKKKKITWFYGSFKWNILFSLS